MYPLLSFGNMYAKGPIFIQYLYKSALLKRNNGKENSLSYRKQSLVKTKQPYQG